MAQETVVKIERGYYSRHFQVVRAMLSAASALVGFDKAATLSYLEEAIDQLTELKELVLRRA